jgi:hypothetical protein
MAMNIFLDIVMPPSCVSLVLMPSARKNQGRSVQGLDKAEDRAYDASIMDSSSEIRIVSPALSSLLWNWWAVPTAR